jgi:hypothetical protein
MSLLSDGKTNQMIATIDELVFAAQGDSDNPDVITVLTHSGDGVTSNSQPLTAHPEVAL